jgi:arylsulfatase A-like enzyme
LLPTLLAMAGARAHPSNTPGLDLSEHVESRAPIAVESALNYPERFVGLRDPDFKYLIRDADGREELYDLRADPDETNNLADQAQSVMSPASRAALENLRAEARRIRSAGGSEPRSRPPQK